MADNDIIREAGLTGDEIIAANMAKLGVRHVPMAMNAMRERVFKMAVKLAEKNGELASSVLIARELGISQAKTHDHLLELADGGRMLRVGSGSGTRYMPIVVSEAR